MALRFRKPLGFYFPISKFTVYFLEIIYILAPSFRRINGDLLFIEESGSELKSSRADKMNSHEKGACLQGFFNP